MTKFLETEVVGDIDQVNLVKEWKSKALEDGWLVYPMDTAKDIDRECKLQKDDFLIYMNTRTSSLGGKDRPYTSVHCWGPDGLEIRLPSEYSMDEIKKQVNVCTKCEKDGPTVRLAFCNRVCADCRVKYGPVYEFPGWCD